MTGHPTNHYRKPLITKGGSGRIRDVGKLESELLEAMDRWIAQQPQPISRAEAVRLALREWLVGKGVTEEPDSST